MPLDEARYAVVLVHGRGGTAQGMLPIARAARVTDAALVALVAAEQSWYPERFLSPRAANEPWLGSALASVGAAVDRVRASGIPTEQIILAGVSQGACLVLEYAAAHAAAHVRFGDPAVPRRDHGSLAGTPVVLACGDADVHIPEAIVRSSASVLRSLHAAVDLRIYPGVGHDIVADQIQALADLATALRGAQSEAHLPPQ